MEQGAGKEEAVNRVWGPRTGEITRGGEEVSPKPASASRLRSPSWPLETGPGASSVRSSCAAYQLCDPGLVSFSELGASKPVSITVLRTRGSHVLSTYGHEQHHLHGARAFPDAVPHVSQLLKATLVTSTGPSCFRPVLSPALCTHRLSGSRWQEDLLKCGESSGPLGRLRDSWALGKGE